MSANNVFKKTEWISMGKKWGDIPPHVERTAKQDFQIPDFIRAQMLPSPGISIKEMLDFTLPNTTATISSNTPVMFFSRNGPDAISQALLLRMRRLPTPMASVVGKLVEFRNQAWLDGYQSVKYTHLCDSVATYFPLWLITLWATVLDLQKTVRKPWVQAREWLGMEMRQQRSRERRALAEDVKAFFGALPWDNIAVRNMWRFLGPHWTTSSMQNDLLDELTSGNLDFS
ncbi:hypothetical protein M405DRAFT_858399 [Rhizopogon salebrosus TDB-379]|nr:hypothetical protein M405DRAFT_858399 [Rhizopogon salebrosus TDB-379]